MDTDLPPVEGLTRAETLVLAVLSRRPLGVVSARAVARAARLGATTVSAALRALVASGHVTRRTHRVVGRDLDVWTVTWGSAAWREIATRVGEVVLPQPEPAAAPSRRIPPRLGHLFWNVPLGRLDTARDGRLIADRVLRGDDVAALAWMRETLASADILAACEGRGLDPRRARLGRLLAGAER